MKSSATKMTDLDAKCCDDGKPLTRQKLVHIRERASLSTREQAIAFFNGIEERYLSGNLPTKPDILRVDFIAMLGYAIGAIRKEREAAAQVAEEYGDLKYGSRRYKEGYSETAKNIAYAIRTMHGKARK